MDDIRKPTLDFIQIAQSVAAVLIAALIFGAINLFLRVSSLEQQDYRFEQLDRRITAAELTQASLTDAVGSQKDRLLRVEFELGIEAAREN